MGAETLAFDGVTMRRRDDEIVHAGPLCQILAVEKFHIIQSIRKKVYLETKLNENCQLS